MEIKNADIIPLILNELVPEPILPVDLSSFSETKKLYDYQQQAVLKGYQFLSLYYSDHPDASDVERKKRVFDVFRGEGVYDKDGPYTVELSKMKGKQRVIGELLEEFFPAAAGVIEPFNFVNSAVFHMATGSGKTLVIVKLIRLLSLMIERGEIPERDFLFLTHRDDLLLQFEKTVREFNAHNRRAGSLNSTFIRLVSLKNYARDRKMRNTRRSGEIRVYCYRSDNLGDEGKEKILDFRSLENDGRWYLFLDEAHRGDREDSKRRAIYSILARKGFLFSFSATFTDPQDTAHTTFNFNLAPFICRGYGKKVVVMKEDAESFSKGRRKKAVDFDEDGKRKTVLKSLLLTASQIKIRENLQKTDEALYHNPLMMTLVNSVNTEEADLFIFFSLLGDVGRGEISDSDFENAKKELAGELVSVKKSLFGNDVKTSYLLSVLNSLSLKDLHSLVFNAPSPGEIEVIRRMSNKKELALKLKTADLPFALLKIGDVSGWLRRKLRGYEIVEAFEEGGWFEKLNGDDSPVNVLMGSRSFYEGWDSNRPGLILFINIGVGQGAQKFILQSVGRGVRIEPVKNFRRRLEFMDEKESGIPLTPDLKEMISPLETLFIIGARRGIPQKVIGNLKKDESLRKSRKSLSPKKSKGRKSIRRKAGASHKTEDLTMESKYLMKAYLDYVEDPRIILQLFDTMPGKINRLKDLLKDVPVGTDDIKANRIPTLLIQRVFDNL